MDKRFATLDAGQLAVLEGIARGDALPQALNDIVLLVERQAEEMLCSILLLDSNGCLRHGAAPNLPRQFIEALDGSAIGATAGSCGAAAFLKQRIVIADIATHPNWVDYRHLALPIGLRACWSSPILSPQGDVLGTFAMYYRDIREPTAEEIAWVGVATDLASIAIVRERVQQDLRRSEARARELARLHAVSSIISKTISRAKDLNSLYESACRVAIEQGLARLAWIGLLSSKGTSLELVAQYGDVAKLEQLTIDLTDERHRRGLTSRVIATGKPVLSANVQADAAAPWRELLENRGLQSCGVFPLTDETQVIGVFALCADRPDYFRPEELQVLMALAGDISYAIELQRKNAERRQMEEAVRASEKLRALIFDTVAHAMFYLQVEAPDSYRFASINRAFKELFSTEESRIVGKLLHELVPPVTWQQLKQHYKNAAATQGRVSWEEDWTRDGVSKRIEVTIAPNLDERNRCVGFVGTALDITARTHAEAERVRLVGQLNQSQRMQALGTLAGGIAHDFNNILAAISGNATLLQQESGIDAHLRPHVIEIQKASARAIELVRQILTFSRHAPPKRETLDPAEVTSEAFKMLRATLPQTIAIEMQVSDAAPLIDGDPTQLHQILMNLGTNAAHALPPRGGVIRFSLDAFDLDSPLASLPGLSTGRYVRLRVSDNGCGMDEQTLKRAFDPFFTTRRPGEGTGLGLSVVHGIVEGHHGAVEIRSQPGEGTEVAVYLPASAGQIQSKPSQRVALGRGERVMYVDDEEALVFLVDRVLSKMGYRVSGFSDPAVALSAFRSRPLDFDVVITDLSMPGLSGPDLAVELRRIRADVPIILTSGFIRPEDVATAERLGINQLVYKANTIDELGGILAREIAALSAKQTGIAKGAATS